MGSLPNLNSIGQDEQRRRDRDKVAARLLAIGGDDRQRAAERQPKLVQHSNYTDGAGRSSAPAAGYQYQVQHRNSLTARRVHRTCSSGTTNRIGDESMIEYMSSYSPISSRSHRNTISLPTAHHHHHHQHQQSALPPLSAASQHFQHQHQHSTGSRHTRRDSVNSSIGANSIRHLLTIRRSIGAGGIQSTHATGSSSGGGGGGVSFGVLVGMGAGCRHKIPIHIKAKVARNFAILCAAHCLTSAILVPMFGLQAASSAWLSPADWTEWGANSGSWLLVACNVAAATSVLFTQRLLQAIGYVPLLLCAYGTLAAFVAAHIYSSLWTLVPAYALLGAIWAPASCAKWNLVVFYASRISCGQQECNSGLAQTTSSTETGIGAHLMADDQQQLQQQQQQHQQQHSQHPPAGQQVSATMGSSQLPRHCNRDERIRRLARWFHAAENVGIVGGALLAAVVMTWCARNGGGCEVWGGGGGGGVSSAPVEPAIGSANVTTERVAMLRNYDAYEESAVPTQLTPIDERQQLMLDAMFNVDAHGARICGADACPKSWYTDVADIWTTTTTATVQSSSWDATGDAAANANRTEMAVMVASDSQAGATVLVMGFLALAALALLLTAASSQVDNTFRKPTAATRCWTDTVIFAGPMAYFVGTEQAYMLGDFTKAFVSCSLGLQKVAGSLIGMGLMQLVVSCTLSMLLRHTKRYAVLTAGFFFHACLLLVLFCWKPSSDDSALFYVIAAAWGACNAMWETLLFALITLTHAGQVVAVSAQVQLWRYVGLAVTFAAHGWLCEQMKITLMFGLLCITVVPYAMLEGRLEAKRRNHHREDM